MEQVQLQSNVQCTMHIHFVSSMIQILNFKVLYLIAFEHLI